MAESTCLFTLIQGRLFTFEAGFWAWALLAGPLIIGEWESESYLWLIMVGISIAMAIAKVKAVRLALTAGAWLVQLVFIANEALVLRDIPAG
jgi:hypothetical protein